MGADSEGKRVDLEKKKKDNIRKEKNTFVQNMGNLYG